jgi:hypothetical protein
MKITRRQFFVLGFLGWVLVSLAPYVFVGETWGMVWFGLNYPTAVFAKKIDVLDWQYPYLFVGVTTLLNAALIGLIARMVGSFFAEKVKVKSPDVLKRPQ